MSDEPNKPNGQEQPEDNPRSHQSDETSPKTVAQGDSFELTQPENLLGGWKARIRASIEVFTAEIPKNVVLDTNRGLHKSLEY